MMERLGRRLMAIAERRAAAKREQLTQQIREAVPGEFTVVVDGEHVVISGRRVGVRWLRDPALAVLRNVVGWFR